MSLNENLRKARRQKNDAFYTQLSDIENELRHYTAHFRNKVVYCNCDDPRVSNFFHYLSLVSQGCSGSAGAVREDTMTPLHRGR